MAQRLFGLKWHYIYFLLAAFDLLTVSAGLYLNHAIIGNYTRSVEINRVWDERLAAYSKLGQLAAAVNAPGNDVFDNRLVDQESAEMRAALHVFERQLDIHRRELRTNLQPAVAAPLLGQLDALAAAMKEMTDEAELIFDYFRADRSDQAGRRMATMDRKYASVNITLMQLRASVAEIQRRNFDRQAAAAESLEWFEYAIGGLILLMVAGATLYGHRIARQMQLDAEEKRRNIAALSDAEARTRCILDTAADGIISFDERGRIESFNQAADRLLRYAPGEAIGQDIGAVIPALTKCLHASRTDEPGSPFASLNRDTVGETTGHRRDGTTFPADVSVSEVGIGGKTVFTAIVRDISDRRKAEEALQLAAAAQAANRAKSAFLATMSHEIRTPMNGVMGALELTLNSSLQPMQREYLEMAMASADALLQVINDILDFSRVESGKVQFEAVDFNLRACLTDALATLSVRAQEKGLAMACHVSPDTPELVVGDPGRLRQVLLNLLGNAIKFTECGGVTIQVHPQAREAHELTLHFAIRDTGIGIPQERQIHIFAPFEQADGSTTRKYGGTGLGLAISAQLIDIMGGAIWVDSEPGKGSTFHFTARLGVPEPDGLKSFLANAGAASPESSHRSALPASYPDRRLRVLVAEDNVINQRIVVRVLEEGGHAVEVANNGKAALAKLSQQSFDVALMDLQMPEMDGFEVTKAIRKREAATGQHLPIIAVTAHAMESDRKRCLQAGMDNYVSKPLNAKELFEKIAQVTAGPAAPAREPELSRIDSQEARWKGDGCGLVAGAEHARQAWPSRRAENTASRSEAGSLHQDKASGPMAQQNYDWRPALSKEVLLIFVTDTQSQLKELSLAAHRSDTMRLKQIAHYLKGSALSLGADRMSQLCLKLENLATSGDTPAVQDCVAAVETEFGRVCNAIEDYLQDSAMVDA